MIRIAPRRSTGTVGTGGSGIMMTRSTRISLAVAALACGSMALASQPVRTSAPQRASTQDGRDNHSAPARVQARAQRAAAAAAPVVPTSTGYYRVPYENGTKVRVSRDENSHTPIGRYDMSGQGGGTHKIVAAARGRIVAIEDGFSLRQDSETAEQCNNNYVWIRHPNGEVSKYSHMRKDSTTKKANLKVGDTVVAGQYLGDEGDVGCAGGDHLHFEIGVPRDTDWFTTVGGFLRDNANSKRNRVPRICGISGGRFEAGQTYTAASEPDMLEKGGKEVARHGMPISDYDCFFKQARLADYEPEWIDMFNIGNAVYVNTVWRPETAGAIAGFHGLTGGQYQTRYNEYKGQGYRPHIVESYLQGGSPRYAVVFKKTGGPSIAAYHGLDANAHQARFNDLTSQGYRPKSVSVISSGGRKYTAVYEKAGGAYQLKSQLTLAEYQQAFNANKAAGRHVAYLNAYNHGGQAYISAIFSAATPAGGKQRHGMTGGSYQTEYNSARQAGLVTRMVTGYADGNQARYAASWRQ